MRREWQSRIGWAGIAVFVLGFVLSLLAASRGWLTPGVRDTWTNRDLANHLRTRGVKLDVQEVSERSAFFTDPETGGRVAVVHGQTSSNAQEYARFEGMKWGEHFTYGPFFIGVLNEPADIELCRRIRAAIR